MTLAPLSGSPELSDIDEQLRQPAEGASARPEWLYSPASAWLAKAAQIATAVAGAAYGFGWLIAARLFGSFDVSPEEVGISFGWVAIRAFLVALASLLLLLAARSLLRAADRYATAVWPAQRHAITAGLLMASVGISITGDVLLIHRGYGRSPAGRTFVVLLPIAAIVAVAILRRRAAQSRQPRGQAGLWLRGLSGALASFVITILLLAPVRLADSVSAGIHAGHGTRLDLLPGVPVLQMGRVRLLPQDALTTGASGPCVIRLGGSEGTSVYWDIDRQRVLRLSDGNVVAAGPC